MWAAICNILFREEQGEDDDWELGREDCVDRERVGLGVTKNEIQRTRE